MPIQAAPRFVDAQPRFAFFFTGNVFRFFRANWIMRGMEANVGVIRDKPGIYSGLWQSQSSNHQLAVCYNRDGKLIVKICTVKDIVREDPGTRVTLVSDNDKSETVILFDEIVSIYPIREFDK